MKIIYDDIIYSLQKSGGCSVYWTEVTKRQDEKAIHNVYNNANENFFYNESNFKIINKWSAKFLTIKRYLNLTFSENLPFIFHSSYYRYCKNKNAINITTVHDFTYEYYRKDLKSNLHKIQKKNAVMHSDGVICISENTKHDLYNFYPNYKGKIQVIYHGYDNNLYNYSGLGIDKRTKNVLFVGSRTSYKGFDFTVSLLSKLPLFNLKIIGGGNLTESEIQLMEELIPNRYKKLGFVSNENLAKLYNESFALFYPSEYEGFGFPAIEAQACGCPVICQKKSSIPEVSGDKCVYVDSADFEKSVNEINKLFESDYYATIQTDGLENVKRFSWEKCIKETMEFYNSVLNS